MEILFFICFFAIAGSIIFILWTCIAERKDKQAFNASIQMIVFDNKEAINTLKNDIQKLQKSIDDLKNFAYATRRNKDE